MALALNLKIIIKFINKKNRNYKDSFMMYYAACQSKELPVTSFNFAIYYCFLSTMTPEYAQKSGVLDMILNTVVSKADRLEKNSNPAFEKIMVSDLILLINLITGAEIPIVMASIKEYTDLMMRKIELLGKPMVLPTVWTNEVVLFAPHTTLKLDERVVKLYTTL